MATRHELPEDALAFAEARRRQTEFEERYGTHTPSHFELNEHEPEAVESLISIAREEGTLLRQSEHIALS